MQTRTTRATSKPVRLVVAIGLTIVFAATSYEPGASAANRPATGARQPAVELQLRPEVQRTLQVLDRLHSYGYTVNTPVRADRAIRAWQRANGLTVDGIVGTETYASLLGPVAASAGQPAVRSSQPVVPVVAAPGPSGGDVEAIIRDVWPDDVEDWAVRIATRESRLQPAVINRNGNATGLFQIMWTVHRGWLCPELSVCVQSDLQDAHTNAVAALALYNRAGGPGPWSL